MSVRQMFCLIVTILLSSRLAQAVDMPGGLMQVSENLKEDLYEFTLSPGYVMSPTGAYLTAGMRVQPNEDIATGLVMGAGEVGYHFGVQSTWYILPDVDSQPAFGVTGGLYFNRMEIDKNKENYFVVKLAPMISKTVKTSWGALTPYSGLNLSPSFRLGPQAKNEFSVKGSFGLMTAIKSLAGVRLWTEVDIAVINSVHEVVFGFSYPFKAL